jgi:A/G-specific adenine glycosylase
MKLPPRSPEPFDALRRGLLEHYDEHHRRLPWRGETDPYRILVSEVMLQQTRVETVIDYYGAWLERFPDLESLASADGDDVLEAWEGLGYYRRARNLHAAARVVRERPGGALPETYAELRGLPGIGEYTAGAVASIAFGEVVPAPDGNVRRVLARLFDQPEPKSAWLREAAASLVDPARPGDWNQALMELGATICSPRSPRCTSCPVADWCTARERGTQEERPAAVPRRAPRTATYALAVPHRAGCVLLVRRPPDGLLAGMWAFPEREVADRAEAGAAATSIALGLGWSPSNVAEPLPVIEHRFTHLHATYVPFLVELTGMRAEGDPVTNKDTVWLDAHVPADIALPVAQRRVLESATNRLRSEVA